MEAVTGWPASAEQWRETTALFGTADWDTGVLHTATVVDADGHGAHSDDAAAAVAGDAAAASRLGMAGVVAVRAAGSIFEVEENLDGWALEPSSGTPDLADLAIAAAIRATQLAAERRGQQWR
jgi:hypothetical protein